MFRFLDCVLEVARVAAVTFLHTVVGLSFLQASLILLASLLLEASLLLQVSMLASLLASLLSPESLLLLQNTFCSWCFHCCWPPLYCCQPCCCWRCAVVAVPAVAGVPAISSMHSCCCWRSCHPTLASVRMCTTVKWNRSDSRTIRPSRFDNFFCYHTIRNSIIGLKNSRNHRNIGIILSNITLTKSIGCPALYSEYSRRGILKTSTLFFRF